MESVITAFIVVIVILFAVLTLSGDLLSTQDTMQAAWQEMEQRLEDQSRTHLSAQGVETSNGGAVVELTLLNDGDTKLADFDQWDVFIQYYADAGSYHLRRLPYISSGELAGNEWAVEGIYLDAAGGVSEVYEPGILNPGEEVVLRLSVSPLVGVPTSNLITVSTANGVGTSAFFSN